jgi:hypothetical protein
MTAPLPIILHIANHSTRHAPHALMCTPSRNPVAIANTTIHIAPTYGAARRRQIVAGKPGTQTPSTPPRVQVELAEARREAGGPPPDDPRVIGDRQGNLPFAVALKVHCVSYRAVHLFLVFGLALGWDRGREMPGGGQDRGRVGVSLRS